MVISYSVFMREPTPRLIAVNIVGLALVLCSFPLYYLYPSYANLYFISNIAIFFPLWIYTMIAIEKSTSFVPHPAGRASQLGAFLMTVGSFSGSWGSPQMGILLIVIGLILIIYPNIKRVPCT